MLKGSTYMLMEIITRKGRINARYVIKYRHSVEKSNKYKILRLLL